MNDFNISKTKSTPAVKFSSAESKLLVSGKSYPEDARIFYDALLKKLIPVAKSKVFHFEFDFEYLSSSSIASILEILKNLKAASPSTKFSITFLHESGDDDLISVGENYQSLTGIPVKYIEKD